MLFNPQYIEMHDYPDGLLKVGASVLIETRFQAERGDFGPGDPDTMTEDVHAVFETNDPVSYERTLPNGRTLQFTAAPTPDGGFVTMATDMTARKRAEEALRESEKRFAEAARIAMLGHWIDDHVAGRTIYCSDELARMFGMTPEQYMERIPSLEEKLALFHPDDREHYKTVTENAYRDGVSWQVEFRSVRPDGEIRYMRQQGEPESDDTGKLIRAHGTTQDITEIKRVEEALREKTEFLALNQIITRAANEAASVEDAMQIALDRVCAHTGWPVGHVYLFDDAAGDLASAQIWHLDDPKQFETFRRVSEATRFASGVGLPGRVLASGEPAWIVDVTKDRNFPRAMQAKSIGVKAGAAFPVLAGRDVLAVLEFFSDKPAEPNDPLLDVMAQIGTQLGRVVERKRAEEALQEAYVIIKDQRDRMEDELNIGREIQMSMIPLTFPPFPDHGEFSVFAALEPAREVGGDFYDYYFIDEERICFCIGDVSGKGVPAALFMAMARTLIKSRAADDRSTASILTHVNDELSVDNQSCMFVTVFAVILNIRTGELLYTNAGHNPPYIKRKDGTLQCLDQRHGPVIGAVEEMVYTEGRDTMAPGDLLLLFTDGVTEAMDVEDQLFSEHRLEQLLTSMDTDDADKVVDNTVAAVKAFEGEAEQADDITILALVFHGDPEDAVIAERRIVIKNRLPEIAAVNENFEAFAEEFGVPRPIIMKFNLMFDEVLNNVISYAFSDDGDHDIEVRMELAGERLIVTISDDGVPFNPLSVATPRTDLALEDREIGSMGIHLVRNLVDDVSYHRRIDKNVLTLMSHLEQKDSAA